MNQPEEYCLTLEQIETLCYGFALAFNGCKDQLLLASLKSMCQLDELDLLELQNISEILAKKYTIND